MHFVMVFSYFVDTGLEKEGWFDPILVIAALKAKLSSYGVQFVTGEVVGFGWRTSLAASPVGPAHKRSQLVTVHVQTGDGRVYPIQFAICVNAAGPKACNIARLAGIGVGDRALALDLPIMSR